MVLAKYKTCQILHRSWKCLEKFHLDRKVILCLWRREPFPLKEVSWDKSQNLFSFFHPGWISHAKFNWPSVKSTGHQLTGDNCWLLQAMKTRSKRLKIEEQSGTASAFVFGALYGQEEWREQWLMNRWEKEKGGEGEEGEGERKTFRSKNQSWSVSCRVCKYSEENKGPFWQKPELCVPIER